MTETDDTDEMARPRVHPTDVDGMEDMAEIKARTEPLTPREGVILGSAITGIWAASAIVLGGMFRMLSRLRAGARLNEVATPAVLFEILQASISSTGFLLLVTIGVVGTSIAFAILYRRSRA